MEKRKKEKEKKNHPICLRHSALVARTKYVTFKIKQANTYLAHSWCWFQSILSRLQDRMCKVNYACSCKLLKQRGNKGKSILPSLLYIVCQISIPKRMQLSILVLESEPITNNIFSCFHGCMRLWGKTQIQTIRFHHWPPKDSCTYFI